MKRILQHKYFKLFILTALVIWAIWQFTEGNIGNGIFLIFLSLIVLFFFVRNEFLLMSMLRLRKEDFDGAEKWLLKLQNPEEALIKPQLAYYYLLFGMIYSRKNIHQAEKYFRKALKTGLILKQDQALAKMSLAGVLMAKRRKREATNLLNEARKLDKKGVLSEQIRMMKQQLKRI